MRPVHSPFVACRGHALLQQLWAWEPATAVRRRRSPFQGNVVGWGQGRRSPGHTGTGRIASSVGADRDSGKADAENGKTFAAAARLPRVRRAFCPHPRGAAQRLQWVQASAPHVVPGDLAGLSVTRTPGQRSPHSRCHPRTCMSSGLLPLSPARTRSGCRWEVTELRTALWGDARLGRGEACHLGSRRGSSA